ncbi:RICIN domain-containing protein [Kitasatospora griseola]|uniref:RICIN domain-containing protein n=1 Tax=Kitasatospora griseola TaxID=2064 RepID=UPI003420ACC3
MTFEPGRTYLIRNKASGLYVTPRSWSTGPVQLQQYGLQGGGHRAMQTWHLMPLDNGDVVLVNKSTGLCFNVDGDSLDASLGVQQYHIRTPEQKPSQTWRLTAQTDGCHLVSNVNSGQYLTVASWSTSPSAGLQQYYRAPADKREHQCWELEVEDEYSEITGLAPVDTDPNDIGDVVRMADFTQPAQDRTPETLIGQVVMPFFAIKDSSPQWQLENSTYYVLKRYGYWQQVYFYEHSGTHEKVETKKETVGLVTNNARAVESTTSISVTAEAAFAVKGFSSAMSTTLSRELKVTTSSSEQHEHAREHEIVRTYRGDGERVAECLWFRGDHYVLERMNGELVMDWRTLTEARSVLDGFTG